MIAVDTNVLVRILVEDDPDQTALAKELLEGSMASGEDCFVSDPVLCEIEWVLDSCYAVPRSKILAMVQELSANEHFVFEDRDVLRRALDGYARGRGDLSDHLIHQKAVARDARATFTFDRALRGTDGFVVLGLRSR